MGKYRKLGQLWRVRLNPGEHHGADAFAYCKRKEIIGIGWGVGKLKHNTYKLGKKAYLRQVHVAHKKWEDNKDWKVTVPNLQDKIKHDDLCWVRHENEYYLCRIRGRWHYKTDNDYDIEQYRKCEWIDVGSTDTIDNRVVNQFTTSGNTIRKMPQDLFDYSKKQYNEHKHKGTGYEVATLPNGDLFSSLTQDACENIMHLYLQIEKQYYVMFHVKNQPVFEAVYIHKETKEQTVSQVKSGSKELDANTFIKYLEKYPEIYLFSAQENYKNKDVNTRIHCLTRAELIKFMNKYRDFMPDNIKNAL